MRAIGLPLEHGAVVAGAINIFRDLLVKLVLVVELLRELRVLLFSKSEQFMIVLVMLEKIDVLDDGRVNVDKHEGVCVATEDVLSLSACFAISSSAILFLKGRDQQDGVESVDDRVIDLGFETVKFDKGVVEQLVGRLQAREATQELLLDFLRELCAAEVENKVKYHDSSRIFSSIS